LCSDNLDSIPVRDVTVKDKKVYDPSKEILPSRIQSNKPHCPKCHVPVTDIGTCPYCQTCVNPKYYNKIKAKFSDINFIDGIIIPYFAPEQIITKYQIIKIKKKGFDQETKSFKKADHNFFKQFKISNFNFDVEIHRKEGGPVIYQTYPRLKMELTEHEKVLLNKKKRALYKIKKSAPCECGCLNDIIDQHHGQILCPTCGKVHDTLFILNKEEI
jgi:hypothetical protein